MYVSTFFTGYSNIILRGGAIGTWTWNWNMELKLLAQTRTLKLQFRMCMHVLYFHKIILVQHSMHLRNGWKFNLYLWCNLFKIKSYIHDARAHAQSNLGEDLLSLKGCLQWLGPRAQGPNWGCPGISLSQSANQRRAWQVRKLQPLNVYTVCKPIGGGEGCMSVLIIYHDISVYTVHYILISLFSYGFL